jgi:hypothetical protein
VSRSQVRPPRIRCSPRPRSSGRLRQHRISLGRWLRRRSSQAHAARDISKAGGDTNLVAGVALIPETESRQPRRLSFTKARTVQGALPGPLGQAAYLPHQHLLARHLASDPPMKDTCPAAGVDQAGSPSIATPTAASPHSWVPIAVTAEAPSHADERINQKHYAHRAPCHVRAAVCQGSLAIFQPRSALRLIGS